MQLKPNFLKPKGSPRPQVNSYSQHLHGKLFSRKKVITPISSEAEIRVAAATRKQTSRMAKNKANLHTTSASRDAHLISSASARADAEMKLGPLTSSLDAKTRRNRRLVAFTAQVLLWAAAFYVLFL